LHVLHIKEFTPSLQSCFNTYHRAAMGKTQTEHRG
jgi:hypothetical protein